MVLLKINGANQLCFAWYASTETSNGIRNTFLYEIMMDELRDYRFYAEDMLHPNQVAIDYIWKRFKETYFRNRFLNYGRSKTIQKFIS
jgi:hypothetical protein